MFQVLANRRFRSCTLARKSHASALAMVASKSLARRRLRLSQAREGVFQNPALLEHVKPLIGAEHHSPAANGNAKLSLSERALDVRWHVVCQREAIMVKLTPCSEVQICTVHHREGGTNPCVH